MPIVHNIIRFEGLLVVIHVYNKAKPKNNRKYQEVLKCPENILIIYLELPTERPNGKAKKESLSKINWSHTYLIVSGHHTGKCWNVYSIRNNNLRWIDICIGIYVTSRVQKKYVIVYQGGDMIISSEPLKIIYKSKYTVIMT